MGPVKNTVAGAQSKGIQVFGDHQRERFLAAPALNVVAGTGFELVLQPPEDCWLDLNRLLVWVAPSVDPGGSNLPLEPEALLQACRILGIVLNGNTQLLRGTDPTMPAASFSPWRRCLRQRLGHIFLEASERLVLEVDFATQTGGGNLDGRAFASVPVVMSRDAGESPNKFSQGVWSSHGPWQVIGNDATAYATAGTVVQQTYPAAGIVDIGRAEAQADTDGAPNRLKSQLLSAGVTEILVPGGADNLIIGPAAGGFEVPLAVWWTGGNRSMDWARLGRWGGNPTQAITWEVQGGVANGNISIGSPFQPYDYKGPARLPDGCSC